MEMAGNAGILLLPLNNTPNVDGIIPGKLFEYLALQRPILCIGPENGDSAKIISDSKAGSVVGFENSEQMKITVQNLFRNFTSGDLRLTSDSNDINKHSRKKLAGDIAILLDEITNNKSTGEPVKPL